MKYSTNFNLNKPERADQYNLDHWNQNTDIVDTQLKANADAISAETTRATDAEIALQNITNSEFKTALLNFCYPVGSLYWSSKSTNPASLFGGTWVQIKDRFVLACGDTYKTVGATGGASSVTLSVSNMPSHSHSFTPSGKVSGFTLGVVARWRDRQGGDSGVSVTKLISNGDFGGGGGAGGIYDKIVYSPTFAGISGTTLSNGSGTSFSILPPYVVKYCWERTA